MNEQPAELHKTSSPLRDQMEAAMLRDDFTITTMAEAAWAVVEPELIDQFHKRDRVIHQLAEMTRLRDNALRAAETAESKVATFREYLDRDFRFWCSPDGIAAQYADKLLEILSRDEASTIICHLCDRRPVQWKGDLCGPCGSEIAAIHEWSANLDPRKEGSGTRATNSPTSTQRSTP